MLSHLRKARSARGSQWQRKANAWELANKYPAPLHLGMSDSEDCALYSISKFFSGIQFQLSTGVPGWIKHSILASFPFLFHFQDPPVMLLGFISQINHLHFNPWLLSFGLDDWVLRIEKAGEEGKDLWKRKRAKFGIVEFELSVGHLWGKFRKQVYQWIWLMGRSYVLEILT